MSDLLTHFLNTYQILTKKQKKIFRHLHYLSKKHRNVFPSHTTIAEKCGCTRDTVVKTIKKFQSWGWIVSIKRCYRSSLYFMSDELVFLDLDNPKIFERVIETAGQNNANLSEGNTIDHSKNHTIYKTELSVVSGTVTSKPETVQHTQCKETKHMLQSIGILGKDLWCIARYGLRAVSLAVEDFKTRKAPRAIANLAAWLTSRCKQYAAAM